MIDNNLTISEALIDDDTWFWNKCQILKTALIFPFGLENNQEILNILHTDSMKAFDNLPSYEITSKAVKFDSINQSDIDVNMINNINSRYYSSHEFKSLLYLKKILSIFSILT